MSIKKKLTVGAMSAALGISLVAGGTWAAFNDIEEASASIAAGELNLDLGKIQGEPIHFSINNLKPGDTMTRKINLKNIGSLAIKDVLLTIDHIQFTDYIPTEGQAGFGDPDTYGQNSDVDFLKQFKVTVAKVGGEGGAGGFPKDIIVHDITLADLYQATALTGVLPEDQTAARQVLAANINPEYYQEFGLNVSSVNPDKWTGLPVIPRDHDVLELTIAFDNNDVRDARGVSEQNKFQGDKADVEFSFEARQWGGLTIKDSDIDRDGKTVKTNKEAYSQDGNAEIFR